MHMTPSTEQAHHDVWLCVFGAHSARATGAHGARTQLCVFAHPNFVYSAYRATLCIRRATGGARVRNFVYLARLVRARANRAEETTDQ